MMSLLDLAVKNFVVSQARENEQPRYKYNELISLVQPISEQIDCLEEALIARSILSHLT